MSNYQLFPAGFSHTMVPSVLCPATLSTWVPGAEWKQKNHRSPACFLHWSLWSEKQIMGFSPLLLT